MQIVAGNQNKLAFTADGRCETPVASRWLYLVLSDSTLLPRVKGCVGVFFFLGGGEGRGRGESDKSQISESDLLLSFPTARPACVHTHTHFQESGMEMNKFTPPSSCRLQQGNQRDSQTGFIPYDIKPDPWCHTFFYMESKLKFMHV